MKKLSFVRALCVGATAIATLAIAAVVKDQSNEYGDPSAVPGTALGNGSYVGQVITVGVSGKLDSVEFALRRFDGFTNGDVTLQIRDVASGKPGNNVLGALTFPNASIAPTPSLYTKFDVSALNLNFTAGQQIAVVVFPINQSGSPFPLALGPNAYAGGDLSASYDGGITWQYWSLPSGRADAHANARHKLMRGEEGGSVT